MTWCSNRSLSCVFRYLQSDYWRILNIFQIPRSLNPLNRPTSLLLILVRLSEELISRGSSLACWALWLLYTTRFLLSIASSCSHHIPGTPYELMDRTCQSNKLATGRLSGNILRCVTTYASYPFSSANSSGALPWDVFTHSVWTH